MILTLSKALTSMFRRYVSPKDLARSKGQVAVEYVLLLAVGILIAGIIVNLVVSRDPESPGFMISKWRQLLELIGRDVIDP